MNIVVGVRVPRLQGEDRCVRWRIELYHGLHWQRSVDEIGRFVVDIPDVDDDALVVGVCGNKQKIRSVVYWLLPAVRCVYGKPVIGNV